MRIAVVALGKIGLPLAVQFADQGHEVIGVDVNADGRRPGQRRHRAVPGRGAPAGEARRARARRPPARDHRLRRRRSPAPTPSCIVVPLFVDDATWEPDFGWMDAATRSLAEHLTPGTLVSYETTLPVGTTRGRWKPMLEEGSGLTRGQRLPPRLLARARAHRPRLRRPAQVPQAHRRALAPRAPRGPSSSTRRCCTFDERPDLAARQRRVGPRLAPRHPRWRSSPRRPTATSTSASPTSSRSSPTRSASTSTQVIEACNSQPYSHIHRPGIAVGGHCIPVYPRLYLSTDPDADVVRTARDAERVDARYASCRRPPACSATSPASRAVVLGAAYRGGVKETAFSGVFATVEALRAARRRGRRARPAVLRRRARALGLEPYHLGEPVDARDRAGRPRRVRASCRPTDCPGRPAARRRPQCDGLPIAGSGTPTARHRRGWRAMTDLVVVGSGFFGLTVAERCCDRARAARSWSSTAATTSAATRTARRSPRPASRCTGTARTCSTPPTSACGSTSTASRRSPATSTGSTPTTAARVYPMPINLGTINQFFGAAHVARPGARARRRAGGRVRHQPTPRTSRRRRSR